jgi:hypothetical protein
MPWPENLVGRRAIQREAPAEMAHQPDSVQREARYCMGYDADWFLPAKLLGRWQCLWYPRLATRASVEAWRHCVEVMCAADRGRFGDPQGAVKLETQLAGDLALLREHFPELLGEAGQAPDVATPEQMGAIALAIAFLMDAQNNGRRVRQQDVALAAGCCTKTLRRSDHFKLVWKLYRQSLQR